MSPTALAILGTLLGGLVTGILQHLITVSARRDRDRQEHRTAIADLLHHAAAHRGIQYRKHEARRGGEPDTDATRAERYDRRTAMTTALTRVRLSDVPAPVRAAAVALVAASIQLGDTDSHNDPAIQAAGDSARTAHDALEHAAVAYLHS
ncbi:hypothetical protein ABZ650_22790 [Streptomyces griseoviridis]|uniref:hypothetical protein n=1 Tax=Streptomyces griseoviridis TaxID=45398 RepID=UPI0033C979C7